ncbi:hypothetical protein BVC80_8673g1 [Macleaya cordata]|uniref:Leucine-rich repeat n=1 Tax=Macleaya cordata TaxID=56857 RepID=A0A200PZN7_MACCD|nr:hypothetical protein BVC80_8673g1 [Macleaya cordata]
MLKTVKSVPGIITTYNVLNLRKNLLNGTLDLGTNFSGQLQLIDLQNNFISSYVETGAYSKELILIGNPVCQQNGATAGYCKLPEESNPPYSTNPKNCVPIICPTDQKASPYCRCSYPYTGTLFFRAPSFSDLGNASVYVALEDSLMKSFKANSNVLPVDIVSLSNPTKDPDNYIELTLNVFPSGKERFNRSDISKIGFMLSNQTFKPPKQLFGPFFFIGSEYGNFEDSVPLPSGGSKKSPRLSLGVIIGASVNGGANQKVYLDHLLGNKPTR